MGEKGVMEIMGCKKVNNVGNPNKDKPSTSHGGGSHTTHSTHEAHSAQNHHPGFNKTNNTSNKNINHISSGNVKVIAPTKKASNSQANAILPSDGRKQNNKAKNNTTNNTKNKTSGPTINLAYQPPSGNQINQLNSNNYQQTPQFQNQVQQSNLPQPHQQPQNYVNYTNKNFNNNEKPKPKHESNSKHTTNPPKKNGKFNSLTV